MKKIPCSGGEGHDDGELGGDGGRRWRHETKQGKELGVRRGTGLKCYKAAYIHRLTNEYRRVVPVNPVPLIFISEATSPTNIGHIYSSVTWHHRRIYMMGQNQIGLALYSSASPIFIVVDEYSQTDE
jgi:hypothetical protein